MNILYICHEYPPARLVGGIGIFVRNISRSLVKAGSHVTVIGLYKQATSTDEMIEGVRVVRVAAVKKLGIGWWLQRRELAKKIRKLHHENKFDIIETSDFDAGFWLIAKLNAPHVVRLNGGEVYFRTLLKEPLRWQYRFSEGSSLRKADAITSVSKYTWLKTKQIFQLPDQDVSILPNPVDTKYFKPGDQKIIKGQIVYSGTFIRKKGVLELFKSLPSVFDEIKEAHLVCVGPDSRDATTDSASTQALALSLIDSKYHSRIQFTGRVAHAEVLGYIQQANVCVYPSYLEAFPNAWIEAMACGKAVIGSSTGSGPEVISDGVTGMLCHPEDHQGLASCIIRVLTDEAYQKMLGLNARKYAQEFLDISALVRQNLDWYTSIIDRYRNS